MRELDCATYWWVMWLGRGHKHQAVVRWATSRTTEAAMSRRQKDPLRELTQPERLELTRLERSQAAPAVEVIAQKQKNGIRTV